MTDEKTPLPIEETSSDVPGLKKLLNVIKKIGKRGITKKSGASTKKSRTQEKKSRKINAASHRRKFSGKNHRSHR